MKTDREICEAATNGPWELMGGRNVIRCPSAAMTTYGGFPYASFGGYSAEDQKTLMIADMAFFSRFDKQKVTQMLDRQEQLESKLKEASEFIQKLDPTIDYDIVAEIEEMLRCR